MTPAKIPTHTDIKEHLDHLHNISNRISTEQYILLLPDEQLYNEELFPGGSPFLSKYLYFDMQEYLEQKTFYRDNMEEITADQNFLDEYYHFITGYLKLPRITKEVLKERITHPSVQYSLITQWVVQRYKEENGETETKTLLDQFATTPWEIGPYNWFPKKKWKEIYAQHSPRALGSEVSLLILLHHREQEETPENFLKGYNTKATATFDFKYGATPAYKIALGVELELDKLTQKAIPLLKKHLGHHAIFKRDGSVSNGVEICTAPASLDIHKKEFKTFFENHAETGLKATNNCGLHVHVDRSKLKQTQIAKILMFMNHSENNTFIENIAGRKANNYCEREQHTWDTTIHKKSGSKYTRVNLAPTETIEFRLFASTLDEKQFNRCLEFVQAVVDYTQSGEHEYSVKEITKKEHFISYTDKHKHFYPTLHNFLHPELKTKTNPTISTGAPILCA